MPKRFDMPIFWDDDELDELRGSGYHSIALRLQEQVKVGHLVVFVCLFANASTMHHLFVWQGGLQSPVPPFDAKRTFGQIGSSAACC